MTKDEKKRLWEAWQECVGSGFSDDNLALLEVEIKDMTGMSAKPKRSGWSAAPYLKVWHEYYGGYFAISRVARVLKATEKEYGVDRLVAGFDRYCKSTDAQYASVLNFCSKVGQWLPREQEDRGYVSGDKEWGD